MKVLVVDDEEGILEILEEYFQNIGFKVLLANNGKAALSLLLQNKNLDLIISDYNMPYLNGVELYNKICKILSEPPPFIIFSGNINEADILKFTRKPIAILRKPCDMDRLGEYALNLKKNL